jgi:phosphinothricin acetyltransferase
MSATAAAPAIVARPAAGSDVPRIAAIYAHHVLTGFASFELDPPDADEMARRRADVVARGLPYLVAEAGGEVLGYAYAAPYRLRPAYRYAVEDSIYVDPGAVGRGIGRLLLERLIADAAARGCRQMVAVIGGSDNHGSIALHKACGFFPAGVLPAVGFKFGRWADSVLMQRALGAGDSTPPEGEGAGA